MLPTYYHCRPPARPTPAPSQQRHQLHRPRRACQGVGASCPCGHPAPCICDKCRSLRSFCAVNIVGPRECPLPPARHLSFYPFKFCTDYYPIACPDAAPCAPTAATLPRGTVVAVVGLGPLFGSLQNGPYGTNTARNQAIAPDSCVRQLCSAAPRVAIFNRQLQLATWLLEVLAACRTDRWAVAARGKTTSRIAPHRCRYCCSRPRRVPFDGVWPSSNCQVAIAATTTVSDTVGTVAAPSECQNQNRTVAARGRIANRAAMAAPMPRVFNNGSSSSCRAVTGIGPNLVDLGSPASNSAAHCGCTASESVTAAARAADQQQPAEQNKRRAAAELRHTRQHRTGTTHTPHAATPSRILRRIAPHTRHFHPAHVGALPSPAYSYVPRGLLAPHARISPSVRPCVRALLAC